MSKLTNNEQQALNRLFINMPLGDIISRLIGQTDSWEFLEDDIDFLQLPVGVSQPIKAEDLISLLLKEVKMLREQLSVPSDFVSSSIPNAGALEDFVTSSTPNGSYVPGDVMDWPGGCTISTKEEAIDCLANQLVYKASVVDQITTDDASDLTTAISLVNELKTALNKMNK